MMYSETHFPEEDDASLLSNAKSTLLLFLTQQNPRLAIDLVGTSTTMIIKQAKPLGSEIDRMTIWDAIEDDDVLSHKMDVNIRWDKEALNTLKTSYGAVASCRTYDYPVPPEQLENALREIRNINDISIRTLAKYLDPIGAEPWRESIPTPSLTIESTKLSTIHEIFRVIKKNTTQYLMNINTDLKRDSGSKCDSISQPSSLLHIGIQAIDKKTGAPINDYKSSNSSASEYVLKADLQWSFDRIHTDNLLATKSAYEQQFTAHLDQDLVFQSIARLESAQRHYLARYLVSMKEVELARNQRAQENRGFQASESFTADLQMALNHLYSQIAG